MIPEDHSTLSWEEIERLANNEPHLLINFALREWGVDIGRHGDDPTNLIERLLELSEGYVL